MPAITKRVVDRAKPGDRRYIVWDSEIRGFGLLVLPSGVKSFIVNYRNATGRSRRKTVGRYGALTPDQARKGAQAVLAAVAKGDDPVAEKRHFREAPTVGDLLDRYLSDHVARHNAKTTAAEARRLVKRHIRPRLGGLKVASVTRQDVLKMHRAMSKTPRQANLTLSVTSKAFALAETWSMRSESSNPATKIPRYPEVERERFLSGEELARLGQALLEAETVGLPWKVREDGPGAKHLPHAENRRTRMSAPVIAAVRLLLFTGARLSEILELRWEHVDFEAGTLALPARKGVGRRPHPISAGALSVLAEIQRVEGSLFVLPRPNDPGRYISKEVMESGWQRLRLRAGLDDVRLHDLRHTVGTYASQAGSNAFLISHLLRQRTLTVTSRYVNPDADPIREVSNAVGDRIAAGLAGQTVGNVLRLQKNRSS